MVAVSESSYRGHSKSHNYGEFDISRLVKMEEEEKESVSLARAAEFISSLISSSYSIRLLHAKWRSIRKKLEELYTGLSAAAEGDDSQENSELIKLLQSIVSTGHETQVIIEHCSDESYSGGKLLLKSDLDVVATKLETHIKRLVEMYSSGALMHSRAIVVSKPSTGASREDIMFYANDLFSRLRIGTSDMKIQVLVALNELLHEDDKYVSIVAANGVDGISLLVSLLKFGDMGVRDGALEAISVIAELHSCRVALVVAGVMASLVQVLETGNVLAKEQATRTLKKLTENSDNAWSVSSHGGVAALLDVCRDFSSSEELVCSACGVLKSLSCIDEIKRFMVEQGAVSVCAELLGAAEEVKQIQAMEFLATISSDDHGVKQKAVKEGVIDSLVLVFDPSSPHSCKAREVALRAIESLCFSSVNWVNFLINSAFLRHTLFFLRNDEISMKQSALKVARRLCSISEETKKAMGDEGFMPELVMMLETNSSLELRDVAAEVLCSLVSIQRNRKRFVQEGENINRILRLLHTNGEKSTTTKFLLSALMYLMESSSSRRKIASSECVKNLEMLAETNVTDAKKVVKKLAGKGFKSILTGIWSF
ncbi:uncharacterized protein [Typha angustifolia]|uniref:uncharacterized protein n=1 Tax=Typha angustifolia TaxID=59011 RepID=UPI003C2B8CD6